ncbi:helix-turn-helix domain-containing protein [Blochmannia endosymbiont of Camponotus (Colobopsis) obliquus]|uniref:helix-turn-helix domain-containing protein n=1 Tax=Blochmannia endosymbiont of Camponotus (Colobopsis) obliquus TaxID=1505597 RepID=UPI00061A6BE5|nr:helix-turn-helix domain-containing protein [Blochmannia endosymbiont of Camponotus (Colobopsis) obliquus]AKC60680.1 helix-turn-helix family protein [Blochmannia endosymbiont of Camponotus (Colobopsis) obliquus]
MNNDYDQGHKTITIGERLRNAREVMGLSQQAVADRLYLKISTIRDIEENDIHPNISSIFFRGYIRSYARLVHISDDEVMLMLSEQYPNLYSKSTSSHSLSLKKINYLQKYNWLIKISCLMFVLIVILVFFIIGVTIK